MKLLTKEEENAHYRFVRAHTIPSLNSQQCPLRFSRLTLEFEQLRRQRR